MWSRLVSPLLALPIIGVATAKSDQVNSPQQLIRGYQVSGNKTTPAGAHVINVALDGCDAGEKGCHDGCIPISGSCCASYGYCELGKYCTETGCCPNGEICSGTGGCDSDQEECGAACMPAGKVCCTTGYCDEGEYCRDDGYCGTSSDDGDDDGDDDSDSSGSCESYQEECNGKCMPSGAVCCDSGYCDSGEECSSTGGCIPEGAVDCGDGTYCYSGYVCVNETGKCRKSGSSSDDGDDDDEDATSVFPTTEASEPTSSFGWENGLTTETEATETDTFVFSSDTSSSDEATMTSDSSSIEATSAVVETEGTSATAAASATATAVSGDNGASTHQGMGIAALLGFVGVAAFML